jgi:leucyl-tRNA synthetase
MDKYDFKRIEPKWRKFWIESGLFDCPNDAPDHFYCLMMYPFPSGDLHVGHGRNYIIGDALARYKMMTGYQVLAPMGWDAFGLPAENCAIERRIHPAIVTEENIQKMKRQFENWGIVYDWKREIRSSDPSFYHWNQWIFLKLFERGLAYRKEAYVNWCDCCGTVLANEQVIGGICERCDTEIKQRRLEQWFYRITAYADRLYDDLQLLTDWPDRVVTMQKNLIGKSHGVEIDFPVVGTDEKLTCFTTRHDTLFGATYMVLAPEHPMVEELAKDQPNQDEILAYAEKTRGQSIRERIASVDYKEGVPTGGRVTNPATGENIPIWISNYVVMEYGTGAVMAVPAHDQRDFEFAREYDLPVRVVICGEGMPADSESMNEAYPGEGRMINSGRFDETPSEQAREDIADWLEETGKGRRAVHFRLRDWLISRQRYWGTPIPIVYCDKCGIVPLPEDSLPLLLPDDVTFEESELSPLATSESFVHTDCPSCGGRARRETDTMDGFVDSSWYFLRYLSYDEKGAPFDRATVDHWMPVDQYIGGIEHAVGHLVYARFMTKFLHDLGMLGFVEPFKSLFTQGMICLDGAKMSKSRRNVVSPDELIDKYGADTERMYTLFIGPPERDAEWNERAVEGAFRFLNRLWTLVTEKFPTGFDRDILKQHDKFTNRACDLRCKTHQTIRKVTRDATLRFHFNTAISATMELFNETKAFAETENLDTPANRSALGEALETILLVIGPVVPHIAEELWEATGHQPSLFRTDWPAYDEELATEETLTIVVQINGKLRDKLDMPADASEDDIRQEAVKSPKIQAHLKGATPDQIIVVPGRLANIVLK